jgi:NADH pyrophosphatase NudC (nudix superfamily)
MNKNNQKPVDIIVGIITRKNKESVKEYLLVSSVKDFGKYTGFFYPPGGYPKDKENQKSFIRRKILEELSIEIKPIKKIATTPADVKNHIVHWWECEYSKGKVTRNKIKLSKVKWFSENDLKRNKKIWPATKSFFTNYLFDT